MLMKLRSPWVFVYKGGVFMYLCKGVSPYHHPIFFICARDSCTHRIALMIGCQNLFSFILGVGSLRRCHLLPRARGIHLMPMPRYDIGGDSLDSLKVLANGLLCARLCGSHDRS